MNSSIFKTRHEDLIPPKECIAILSENEWEPSTPPKTVATGYGMYPDYLNAQLVRAHERAERAIAAREKNAQVLKSRQTKFWVQRSAKELRYNPKRDSRQKDQQCARVCTNYGGTLFGVKLSIFVPLCHLCPASCSNVNFLRGEHQCHHLDVVSASTQCNAVPKRAIAFYAWHVEAGPQSLLFERAMVSKDQCALVHMRTTNETISARVHVWSYAR